MFSFFTRKEKINLDCFVYERHVYEYTPIVKAVKTIPQWWKELPRGKVRFDYTDSKSNPRDLVNMRSCYGFTELYKRGAVLEHWCDVSIKTTENDYKFYYSSGTMPMDHKKSEYGNSFDDYQHVKLISPWIFKEKTGTKFAFIGCEWNHDKYQFKIPPGILDFSITCATNINIFLPRKKSEFVIPIGLPLVHFLPLSDKELIIHNHLLDRVEYDKTLLNTACSFYGWRNLNKLKKRNEVRKKEPECPFS